MVDYETSGEMRRVDADLGGLTLNCTDGEPSHVVRLTFVCDRGRPWQCGAVSAPRNTIPEPDGAWDMEMDVGERRMEGNAYVDSTTELSGHKAALSTRFQGSQTPRHKRMWWV
nr:uncharacterized protein CTRU02_02535 [Colletotrichum truncatum]KAF6798561.1 hypothetical protein CTRU02_02535 [Colletotrichum truncatum]